MIHTVNYVKRNSFIKDIKGASIKRFNKEGEEVSSSEYRNNFLPSVARIYCPPTKNGKKMINLSQAELDKLVQKMFLYDEHGELIEFAPIRNPKAKFWGHEKAKIRLEAAGTNLDDEDPVDLFWLKVFEADPRFRLSTTDVNPAMSAKVDYVVTKLGEDISEKSFKLDEVAEATEFFHALDYSKRLTILRAMGIDVRKPSEDAVKRSLLAKITDQKDLISGTGERNIVQFIRLCKENPKDLNLEAYAKMAWKNRVLSKIDNKYFYNQIPLGRTLGEVQNFLADDENADITAEIIKQLKDE